jgi:hypothetical protein
MNEAKRGEVDCPHCGASVPRGAKACPTCGSDEQTGWAPDADSEGLDLPAGYGGDDDFNYDDFARREFPEQRRRGRWAVAMGILIVVILLAITLWFCLGQA